MKIYQSFHSILCIHIFIVFVLLIQLFIISTHFSSIKNNTHINYSFNENERTKNPGKVWNFSFVHGVYSFNWLDNFLFYSSLSFWPFPAFIFFLFFVHAETRKCSSLKSLIHSCIDRWRVFSTLYASVVSQQLQLCFVSLMQTSMWHANCVNCRLISTIRNYNAIFYRLYQPSHLLQYHYMEYQK